METAIYECRDAEAESDRRLFQKGIVVWPILVLPKQRLRERNTVTTPSPNFSAQASLNGSPRHFPTIHISSCEVYLYLSGPIC